jgi:signal transduction histidine kinase
LADAERGTPPDRLAASLREVLADVEAVGTVQHPIQLEIGGLVAALEWLAERIESRSDVSVTMNVADPVGEPPPDVAAGAFRIAALALDNVARHAPGSNATLDLHAGASVVELSIWDQGPGITDDAAAVARTRGRRGIADMGSEADEVGGNLEVTAGPNGSGTSVHFSWRSAAGR